MAAARLERLGDSSQSERQSRFRPIDGRRARQPPRRTRYALPVPRSRPQPQCPPLSQPQLQRDARPWRRGTDEYCAGARAPGSLAPGVAAPPRAGPRRPRPQLAQARCPRGRPALAGAPAHHAPAVSARRAPLCVLPADLSHPVERQLPVSAAGRTRGAGGESPALGLQRRSRTGRKLGGGVPGRGTGCPTRSVAQGLWVASWA